MRKQIRRGDNQGSTIIIVIVAISLIAILATLALTLSATNLQMKSVERKSKANFYNAESALEELKASMQTELGELSRTVYKNTMLTYAKTPLKERDKIFKNTLLKQYLEVHAVKGELPSHVKLEGGNSSYDTGTLRGMLVNTKGRTTMDNPGKNYLEWKEECIWFKNVTISYVDESNYKTKIVTDIKVALPDVSMEALGNAPQFNEYAIVANTSLFVSNANSEIIGNVYAGENGVLVHGSTAKLGIQADKLITKGDIRVSNGAILELNDMDTTDTSYDLAVWAKNIETVKPAEEDTFSPKINLIGNAYIADDCTLNADHSTVSLQGSYYGYGYEAEPSKSSAILINSSHSTLDLSKLSNLYVAGHAFIEPSSSSDDILASKKDYISDYVRTGDAISTKGNQAVYRLPEESIGVQVKNGTKRAIGSNPLSINEYQKMKDAGDTIIVDISYKLPFSNKSISHYVDSSKPYHTIFDQTNTTSYVYFYPNFKSQEAATEYMQDYAKSRDITAIERLKSRMSDYENTIKLPGSFVGSDGRKTLSGNTVAYDVATEEFKLYDNTVSATLPSQYIEESKSLNNMYQAYCTKLVPSIESYSAAELAPYDNLFDQLIVYESGSESQKGIKEHLGTETMKIISSTSYGAFVLADNKEGGVGELIIDATIPDDVHLIVATGDVTVKRSFKGTIICKGRLQIEDGVTVEADSLSVSQLLANTEVKSIFRDYVGLGSGLMSKEHKEIHMDELITTENWKKE